MNILICTDYYFPFYKAGGPITSIYNITKYLSKFNSFWIYSKGVDIDGKGDENLRLGVWIDHDEVKVYYTAPQKRINTDFGKVVYEVDPKVIYLNSMFSLNYTIRVLINLKLKHRKIKIILAPRGMLKESALDQKKIKKQVFLFLSRHLGLYNNLLWQATNEMEKSEILSHFPNANVVILDNLPPPIEAFSMPKCKRKDSLKLLCIGRIHPIKNILYIIKLLTVSQTEIMLEVVGNIEDKIYYNQCIEEIRKAPANVSIKFIGAMPPWEIKRLVNESHLFVLPTLGENYGHAIIEALSVGRPVLISDQTPWKNLKEYNAGWELPLSDKQGWINVIEEAASWDQAEFDKHCEGALAYAKAHTNNEELVKKYVEMFGGRETTEGTKEH